MLVVSPHYDDVPLALGQSLRDGALHGAARVDVRVVFGRTNWTVHAHPTRRRAPVVTAWRRAEEIAAALRFGYRVRSASLEEVVLRNGSMVPDLFGSAEDQGGPGSALDPLVGQVVDLLQEWRRGVEVMWVPAGFGRHVDHRIVAHAAVVLVRGGDTGIAFYEDRPYIAYLDDREVAGQLDELGIGVERHVVSGLITDSTQRSVRRIYRSQMSEFFVEAQTRDREAGGVEAVWVPTGRLQKVTDG